MPTPKEGYYLADGTRVPGVTTVLSRYKDSGGLIYWAFKRGQSGARELYGEKAAEVGTAAHALVEAHIKGTPVDLVGPNGVFAGLTDEQTAKAQAAFDSFLTWAHHSRLEIVHTEVRLLSERHRFGGTPDAIGRIDNGLCLLDWKTSNRTYADHMLQLAAYIEVWEENNPFELLTGAHLIRFGKELGDFDHKFRPRSSFDVEWRAFLLRRELYDLDKLVEKRAA